MQEIPQILEGSSHQAGDSSRLNRKERIRHDKQAYKDCNVFERCYCRLKDFRRVATRYDKLEQNYFPTLCLAAVVLFWL
jgi:transposase